MTKILPYQLNLSPALPVVLGNKDYLDSEQLLHRINEMLCIGNIDSLFIRLCFEKWQSELSESKKKELSGTTIANFNEESSKAIRTVILKSLLGFSFRELSRQLAQCPLYRWFCGMETLGPIRVPGKSVLQEYANRLPAEMMETVITQVILLASEADGPKAVNPLYLKNEIELDTIWMDSTCVKTNIHFPVDWVLLRDGVRTLMKATILIRNHGLKHRMVEPAFFMKKVNGLAMEMCANRWQIDSKKKQKKTFRKIKDVVKLVKSHALRHRDLLEKEWETTDWSYKQAMRVINRIDGVVTLLPEAVKQAHERIIGERLVANKEKILSLYERETRVLVRGKAGAEIEFGNSLRITEQVDGIIIDWKLHKEIAPGDSKQVKGTLERIEKHFGEDIIKGLGTDRGFASKANDELLEEKNIYNGICPKSPKQLEAKKHSGKFQKIQNRRAQTEGRIGILKNKFMQGLMKSKGFERREIEVGWHILTHNLWVLARLETTKESVSSLPLEEAA